MKKSNVGRAIRKRRELRGLSSGDLARSAKIAPQTLSNWERSGDGQLPRDARALERVALALGWTFGELLTEAGFIKGGNRPAGDR